MRAVIEPCNKDTLASLQLSQCYFIPGSHSELHLSVVGLVIFLRGRERDRVSQNDDRYFHTTGIARG